MATVDTDRALMAVVYALIEDTGEYERCGGPATNQVEIGQTENGEPVRDRALTLCLPCLFGLLEMVRQKGRLGRV